MTAHLHKQPPGRRTTAPWIFGIRMVTALSLLSFVHRVFEEPITRVETSPPLLLRYKYRPLLLPRVHFRTKSLVVGQRVCDQYDYGRRVQVNHIFAPRRAWRQTQAGL